MAGNVGEARPLPERIDDREDLFYRWVPHTFTNSRGRTLNAGAFGRQENVEEGVSFDWSRYATPEQTLGRSARPEIRAGVVKTTAGQIWDSELKVRHAPELDNRAHSLVTGPSETRVRKTLVSICTWAIELPTEGQGHT